MPAATVFRRAATASYGPKKLLGSSSSAFGSIVSVFDVIWLAVVMSLFAVTPSTVVCSPWACPRTVPSSVNSIGRHSGV